MRRIIILLSVVIFFFLLEKSYADSLDDILRQQRTEQAVAEFSAELAAKAEAAKAVSAAQVALWDTYLGWGIVIAVVVLAGFVFDSDIKVRPAFQLKKRYNLIIALGFWFLVCRAVFDITWAVYSDSAYLFLLATLPTLCWLVAVVERFRSRFLPLAGGYMLLLGGANVVYGFQYLTSMPLSALPNIIIAQVIPTGLGVYFLLHWHKTKGRK